MIYKGPTSRWVTLHKHRDVIQFTRWRVRFTSALKMISPLRRIAPISISSYRSSKERKETRLRLRRDSPPSAHVSKSKLAISNSPQFHHHDISSKPTIEALSLSPRTRTPDKIHNNRSGISPHYFQNYKFGLTQPSCYIITNDTFPESNHNMVNI